jgi:hypothetical protein
MKTLLAAAAFSSAIVGAAEAQNRSDYYESAYFMVGMYLRASVVCDNKSFIEYGFNFVGSKEFRAFSASYPKTVEKWMREGAGNFNRGVMQDGIPAACSFMLSKIKRG